MNYLITSFRVCLISIFTFIFLIGCDSKNKNTLSELPLTEYEIDFINKMMSNFEQGMAGSSTYSSTEQLYKLHAQRMRMDVLEQFPFTENYPYSSKKTLLPEFEVTKIRFLTDACGYQLSTGESVNFICPVKNSPLLSHLEEQSVGLIDRFIADYRQSGTIAASMQQYFLMEAIEELDFDRYENRLFYSLVHTCLNEEWIAGQQISKNRTE